MQAMVGSLQALRGNPGVFNEYMIDMANQMESPVAMHSAFLRNSKAAQKAHQHSAQMLRHKAEATSGDEKAYRAYMRERDKFFDALVSGFGATPPTEAKPSLPQGRVR